MVYTRIIVPLDGSQLAECALPLAAALVARFRGSVTDAVIRAGLAPTMVVPPVALLLGPAIH